MKPFDPQRFERAVKTRALQRAKSAVQSQILAEGKKIGQFSSLEINQLREGYFSAHMEELITKAIADVWTFPEFARYLDQGQRLPSGLHSLNSSPPTVSHNLLKK